MDSGAVAEAADLLAAARRRGKVFSGFPSRCAPQCELDGYAIQHALRDRLTDQFGQVAGFKIGCTTKVMQDYLGVDHPCSGAVFEANVHHGTWSAPYDHWHKVGVECEIAVRTSSDLDPAKAPYTRDSVYGAVKTCMAALEIVDDRYIDFRSLDVATLIADDFFGAGCVLGESWRNWRDIDLAKVSAILLINGRTVGRGRGAAVLGHPLEALAQFANETAARGETIPGGSLVLTGSVVETHWLKPGDHAICRFDGLGQAALIAENWPPKIDLAD